MCCSWFRSVAELMIRHAGRIFGIEETRYLVISCHVLSPSPYATTPDHLLWRQCSQAPSPSLRRPHPLPPSPQNPFLKPRPRRTRSLVILSLATGCTSTFHRPARPITKL